MPKTPRRNIEALLRSPMVSKWQHQIRDFAAGQSTIAFEVQQSSHSSIGTPYAYIGL